MVQEMTVDPQGRVLLPAEVRRSAGIKPGDRLIPIVEENGMISLRTRAQIITEIKEVFARAATPGESVVDELLRERREEVGRDLEEEDRWRAQREKQSPSS